MSMIAVMTQLSDVCKLLSTVSGTEQIDIGCFYSLYNVMGTQRNQILIITVLKP